MGLVEWLVQWADMSGIGYMVPEGGTLVVGMSYSLLFDVLSGCTLSSEGVCFFSSLNLVWVWLRVRYREEN